MERDWRLVEHPADVGIEARGPDLPAALEQAVTGLAAILTGEAVVKARDSVPVQIQGDGPEEQLMALLEEVLFLLDARGWVAGRATIRELAGTHLTAVFTGEDFDEERHGAGVHVKAITWHQLSVRQEADGVVLTVIVDV